MGERNMIYKVFLFVFFFQIKSELSEALHQFKENIMDRGTWSTIPQVCNQQNPACGNAYNSDGWISSIKFKREKEKLYEKHTFKPHKLIAIQGSYLDPDLNKYKNKTLGKLWHWIFGDIRNFIVLYNNEITSRKAFLIGGISWTIYRLNDFWNLLQKIIPVKWVGSKSKRAYNWNKTGHELITVGAGWWIYGIWGIISLFSLIMYILEIF